MAVRIRMKKMGRTHRPFFRVCAIDGRRPRDGKVIEELGYYDPMVKDTDARAVLNGERIDYWLGVGAQPSDKVSVLIKKYGTKGTHLDVQKQALARLKIRVQAPEPVAIPRTEAPATETPASESPASKQGEPAAEKATAKEAATPEAATPEAATPEAATPEASAPEASAPDPTETKSAEESPATPSES